SPSPSPSPTASPGPILAVTSSIADGATLSGTVIWTAGLSTGTADSVDFYIDGVNLWTERFAPYRFNGDPTGTLDTRLLANGPHTLGVTANGTTFSISAVSSVTVANAGATPT